MTPPHVTEILAAAMRVVRAFDDWSGTPDIWIGDDLLQALSELSDLLKPVAPGADA